MTLHGVLLGEGVCSREADILNAGTKADRVFARSRLPGLSGLVVGSQVIERECHHERLTLPRLQLTCLGKGLQLARQASPIRLQER